MDRNYYNGYSSAYLRFKEKSSFIKKILFATKILAVLTLNGLVAPLSILFGLTTFFNALGITYKTKGKLDAIIHNRPLNYYENICGN